jgi:hypothetical protein
MTMAQTTNAEITSMLTELDRLTMRVQGMLRQGEPRHLIEYATAMRALKAMADRAMATIATMGEDDLTAAVWIEQGVVQVHRLGDGVPDTLEDIQW